MSRNSSAAKRQVVMTEMEARSDTPWRDRPDAQGISGDDVSARLTWKDLTVTVTMGNSGTQKVLEGLTGYAEPGTLTALMGPSGSGKSTLLDALSSRLATNAFLSGSILLNGHRTKLSFGTAVSMHIHIHIYYTTTTFDQSRAWSKLESSVQNSNSIFKLFTIYSIYYFVFIIYCMVTIWFCNQFELVQTVHCKFIESL